MMRLSDLMHRISQFILLWMVGFILVSCSPPSSSPSNPQSQERPDGMEGTIRGSIVHSDSGNAITIESLSNPIVRKSIPFPTDPGAMLNSFDGPDSSGRMILTLNIMQKREHSLHLVQVDEGIVTPIFTRSGDALWDGVIGMRIHLSPEGGKAAFVGRQEGVQMVDPMAYLMEGPLETWDIEQKQQVPSTLTAIDRGISWFPDGSRIAYCALVDKKEILTLHPDCFPYFGAYKNWDRIPTICVHDFASTETRILYPGEFPMVSPCGRKIYVDGLPEVWPHEIHLEPLSARFIVWPRDWAPSVLGHPQSDAIIFSETSSPTFLQRLIRYLPFANREDARWLKVMNLTTLEIRSIREAPNDLWLTYSLWDPAEESES